jgi:hypothetical protein
VAPPSRPDERPSLRPVDSHSLTDYALMLGYAFRDENTRVAGQASIVEIMIKWEKEACRQGDYES